VLHATNIEFIERGILAEDFIRRRKKRVVLYLLKAFVKFNCGSIKRMSPLNAFVIWHWLKQYSTSRSLDFGLL
jgi:hypothetical protein